VERTLLYWESGEDKKLVASYAEVYGREAILNEGTEKQENALYCFFIYHDRRVWQASSTNAVSAIMESMKIEHDWDKYQNKIRMAKMVKATKRIKSIGRKKAA